MSQKPTICACMIVKNESRVIARCLASVKSVIDTWVIADTGSTDNTVEIIEAELSGIPGTLIRSPFVNFKVNRDEVIHAGRGKADFLLLVDADQVFEFKPGWYDNLSKDAYYIPHKDAVGGSYLQLISSKKEFHYEGVTHEFLTSFEHFSSDTNTYILCHHIGDGGSKADKFTRDIRLLLEDLEKDPNNPRSVFHLAQSYECNNELPEALKWYRKYREMDKSSELHYLASFRVGYILGPRLGEWNAAVDALVRAWQSRPQRLEAVYELIRYYMQQSLWLSAYAYSRLAILQPFPPNDFSHIQNYIYEWGLLVQYSIITWYVGDYRESFRACSKLLEIPDLPRGERDAARQNRLNAYHKMGGHLTTLPPPLPLTP